MACELFATQHRTFAGTLIEPFWPLAMCVLVLLAYLIQNWVNLQLTISLLGLLTVPLYWYVLYVLEYNFAFGKTISLLCHLRKRQKSQ